MLYLKANYSHSHNKPGELLARKLKGRYINRKISKLIHPVSKVAVKNPHDIANSLVHTTNASMTFLLTHWHPHPWRKIFVNLSPVTLPCLTEEQAQSLAAPFTPDKIEPAIWTLPFNKVPGIDDLTNIYYRKFPRLLSVSLAEVLKRLLKGSSQRRCWGEGSCGYYPQVRERSIPTGELTTNLATEHMSRSLQNSWSKGWMMWCSPRFTKTRLASCKAGRHRTP